MSAGKEYQTDKIIETPRQWSEIDRLNEGYALIKEARNALVQDESAAFQTTLVCVDETISILDPTASGKISSDKSPLILMMVARVLMEEAYREARKINSQETDSICWLLGKPIIILTKDITAEHLNTGSYLPLKPAAQCNPNKEKG